MRKSSSENFSKFLREHKKRRKGDVPGWFQRWRIEQGLIEDMSKREQHLRMVTILAGQINHVQFDSEDVSYFMEERVRPQFAKSAWPYTREETNKFMNWLTNEEQEDEESIKQPERNFPGFNGKAHGVYYSVMIGQGSSISVSNRPYDF